MGKNKSYIFLGLTVLILLLVGYFVAKNSKGKKEEVLELEINFVSDHQLTNNNSNIPTEISVFFKSFELKEKNISYKTNISFRRIDLKKSTFSKVINNSHNALPNMYLVRDKENYEPITSDTLNIVYFYLVSNNSSLIDNVKFFNDENVLRNYINDKLKNENLFPIEKKINRVTILILSEKSKFNENNDIYIKTPVDLKSPVNVPGVPIESSSITVKQEIYDVKLDFKGNNFIAWNSKLANSGATLSLIIERNGNRVENIDVSGSSGYSYVPGSDGDLIKTKVILKVEGVEFKGKTSFTTDAFTCSVH